MTTRGDPAPGPCTANHCTLREAIRAANASVGTADKVVLPSRGTYTLSIGGEDDGALMGDLDITNDPLQIVHSGKGRATIDANRIDRVFDVFTGAPATFKKLVIRGGNALGMSGYGGGIRSGARLTILSSHVIANRATLCGGGIHTAGAVALIIRHSRVATNWASSDAGGISHSCFGGAGPLTLEDTTVAGNVAGKNQAGAGRGGGIYLQTSDGVQSSMTRSTWSGNQAGNDGGGIYTDLGRLAIRDSTISGNRTGAKGGGIDADGTDPLTIVNSTVSGNRADSVGGGISQADRAILNAVTVVRNRANADSLGSEAGGGLYNDGTEFRVQNSLVALNTLSDLFPGEPPVKNDCSGSQPFDSLGRNLLSTRYLCSGFNATGDLRRGNPRIGALRLNGGPTKTVALKAGSPALNRANPASAPARDQRGVKRRDPDIGAYERR